MSNQLAIAHVYLEKGKETKVIEDNDWDSVMVDFEQGGHVKIKMTSEGVIVDMWAEYPDETEGCIRTAAATYEELRGE